MSEQPRRARLLFLSHRLPFPPHSGAAIRTFNILRELSSEFEIDALCFDRADPATAGQPVSERLAALRPYARCEAFPIPSQGSTARLASDHIRSVVTRRPYTWFLHDDRGFVTALRNHLASTRYDLVHVDSLDLVRALDEVPAHLVACTHHNVESELLLRRSQRESSMLAGGYMRHQARLLRAAEQHWVPRVAMNLCTSEDDVATLRGIAPSGQFHLVPNGVDDEYFKPTGESRTGGMVFVGGTGWHPNKDALEWFTAEVLPAIRAAGIESGADWVGRVKVQEQLEYAAVPGLTLTGYVDDVRPYLSRARCFVAPIRVGGGTRLKILDAWAMGTPIVGTAAAMEGLAATDEEHYLRAETPAEFAEQISRLFSDPGLASKLSHSGRFAVESRYAWRRIGADLRSLYRSGIAKARR